MSVLTGLGKLERRIGKNVGGAARGMRMGITLFSLSEDVETGGKERTEVENMGGP